MKIPFVKPVITDQDERYVLDALKRGLHSGGLEYTKKSCEILTREFGIGKVLLTTSCTDALEMASILINPVPGDEFIVPSYTFSSTANAFVSRGMVPVFCDIDSVTLNMDPACIEPLITEKTKAIVPIHYAGIPAEMDSINEIAARYNLPVIEDAAQAVNSKYKGRYAGSLSDLGTFSFHATKSYSCGEGGALCMNDSKYYERSEFLLEKGTDRSLVINGQKNKYSWVDHGSSFLLSDVLASMLYSQLSQLDELQEARKKVHDNYVRVLEEVNLEGTQFLTVPSDVATNYHAFWLLLKDQKERDLFIRRSLEKKFTPYIGYVALHTSPMGIKVGRVPNELKVTEDIEGRIVRLPFYIMDDEELEHVYHTLKSILLALRT